MITRSCFANLKREALVFLLTTIAAVSFAQSSTLVVPNSLATVEGNSGNSYPFNIGANSTMRYQQVYAASEFGPLINFAGGWILNVFFRGDATNGTQLGLYMPSVEVNLSTTPRGSDELSATFSDNVGTDDTVVFSGRLDTDLIGGHGDGPETFSFWIHLAKLFFYNPAAGNLLLDVRVFQGNTNVNGMIQPVFDAVNVTNDSVSRVWRGDVNASTGLVETVGVVTEFNFWRNPKLTVQHQTNSVVLAWPANPPAVGALPDTVLQSIASLGPQAEWQAITNGIVTNNLTNTYTIPLESAGAPFYFRLVSTTPP